MSSITKIVERANQGSDTAVAKLWDRCSNRLMEKAQKMVRRFSIRSTEPEEIASAVFAQCVLWSRDGCETQQNSRKFWALLSLATFMYGRRIQRHDSVDKRPAIWDSVPLREIADLDAEFEQVELWDEYRWLVEVHPLAEVVLPLLIDRQPIDVVAKKLDISVRSAYRIVSELRKQLTERLYA